MDTKTIPPTKPYFPKEDVKTIQDCVQKILNSGRLTLGEYTKRFETEFSHACRVKHAVAVNSGTSALEVALRSLGLSYGEVLVPTNTFTATAAAVIFSGCEPVLTDVNPKTLCIDLENVQKHLTPKTKAVIAVHIGGTICPEIMDIAEFCKENHLFLIEDAAHAQGSTLDGLPAGSFGDVGCFSFYPTKIMTSGEGGMITTNREKVARKAVILRDQGKEGFGGNAIVELGYNWRMNEISAAIGLTQLRRLAEFIRQRRKIAKYYDGKLCGINGIKPMNMAGNSISNYYKYIFFLLPDISRNDFKMKLKEKGVRCGGEVYWPPLHMQPIYQRLLGVKKGDFPAAEEACNRMVCLPMYSQMRIDEAEYVMEKIEEVRSSS